MKKIASLLYVASLCLPALVTGCVGADFEGDDADEMDMQQAEHAATNIRFGVAPQWYQTWSPPSQGPANVDVVVVGDWLIENGFTSTHQTKIQQIRAKGKLPYLFGYIATAKTKKGLNSNNDCDGNTGAPLCQQGATWIRNNIDSNIVPAYKDAATKISQALSGGSALIHIEPDWYQFSEKAQQNAFTKTESNGFMNKILGAIKQGCPTCKVVIDFSPWFSPTKTKWATSASDFYAGWDRSVAAYVGLTGKPFPFTEGKIDNFTYAEISQQLALPLVIVDAYTYGGGPIDIDSTWLNKNNINKAVSLGVNTIILSQQGNVSGYDQFIAQVKSGN
jgi:hypothetical protein